MSLNPSDKLTKKLSVCQLLGHNSGSKNPDLEHLWRVPALSVMVTKPISGLPWPWADGDIANYKNEMTMCWH